MVLIGDYSWVLYVAFVAVAAFLALYGITLLAMSRASHFRREHGGVRPATGRGLDAASMTG
ncbi:MAG: hypothetical protein AB1384_00120 [Actinomycetota bacterium]